MDSAPTKGTTLTAPPGGSATLMGLYRVERLRFPEPAPLNQEHSWEIRVVDSGGTALNDAVITFGGGMPEHAHGMPTEAKVTRAASPGIYRIDGIKYHMPGRWQADVRIEVNGRPDVARFEIDVQ